EPDRVVRRDGDAAVAHHLLEQVLVHREGRAGDAGADVGDIRELEQALHGAVLAERAVQDRQDDVDRPDRGERPASGWNRQRLRGTRLGISYQDMSRTVRSPRFERPAPVAADCDLGDLVPVGVEWRAAPTRRGERYLVLARAPARENGHANAAPSRAHGGGGGPDVVVDGVVVPGPGGDAPAGVV